MSESQFRSTIIKLLVALEKKTNIKDSRDFIAVELRSNQAEIKNKLNEMQSKLGILMMRVNEVEERVSNIEDKLLVKKQAEEKRGKQLRDHEERLREINDSLRRKKSTYNWGSRALRGTEGQKAYLSKSQLITSLIWGGKQTSRSRR